MMFNKYLITGTSSGLGEGLAVDLINNNENVIGLSTSSCTNQELISSPRYKHLSMDLSNLIGVASTNLNDIVLPSDKICLIINAAQFTFDDSISIESNEAIKLFNVNYHSAVALIKLLKGNLKRVIFINSISGLKSQYNQSQYSASKHALQAYSETLAKESIELNFDVMTINPGGIDTPLWSKVNSSVDSGNFLQIDTVVDTVKFISRLPYNTYIKEFSLLPSVDVMSN